MKLDLVKRYELENVKFLWSSITLNNDTVVALITDTDSKYSLIAVSPDNLKCVPLEYLETFVKARNEPVLFSNNRQFGIIKNPNELYLYHTINTEPEIVPIKNKKMFGQVLPSSAEIRYANPISDTNLFPVCFEMEIYDSHPRYLAFLDFDFDKKQALWKSWTQVDMKTFPFHYEKKRPPKLDSVMIKENEVFIFTSGGKTTPVNKWGMDYYGLVRATDKGSVTENILDSGNLNVDYKKRGVNGVFTASQKYVILTPVFQSDEWKGRQKLFSLESRELLDVEFPRGFGKYPQIIQHNGNYFWIYLRDTKQIAICKEVLIDK